jgi:Chaperone of endosialidase
MRIKRLRKKDQHAQLQLTKSIMKTLTKALAGLLSISPLLAQDNVGIGTTSPNPGAILELVAPDKGFLMTRLNSTDTTIGALIVEGMMFYAQDINMMMYYDGGTWQTLSTGINYWGANGTDIFNLNSGNIGFGTNNPQVAFHMEGNSYLAWLKSTQTNSLASTEIRFGRDDGVGGFLRTGSISDPGSGDYFRVESPYFVQFVVNGAERMRVDGSGQVGIGISATTATLDVLGTVRFRNLGGNGNQIVVVNNNGDLDTVNLTDNLLWSVNGTDIYNLNSGGVAIGATSTALSFQVVQNLNSSNPVMAIENQDISGDVSYGMLNSGSATAYTFGIDASDANKFKISNGGILGSNDRITINSLGNVGIGTTNPAWHLHVSGTGFQFAQISSTNSWAALILDKGNSTSSAYLNLRTSGSDRWILGDYSTGGAEDFRLIDWTNGGGANYTLYIERGGINSVGIGTNTPMNKLDVEGGVAIGVTYSGTNTAPTNGLIVEGQIAGGTPSPASGSYGLHIHNSGTASLGKFTTAATGIGGNDGISIGYVDVFGGVIMVTENAGIRIGTNSSYHSYISSTGNWGLGTLTPLNRLHVSGNAEIDGVILGNLSSWSNSWTTAALYNPTASRGSSIYLLTADAGNTGIDGAQISLASGVNPDIEIANREAGGIDFFTNGYTQRMALTTAGNLGIGTTVANNKLDVEGAVAIGASYSGASIAPINGMIVEGQVGIGTSSVSSTYKMRVVTPIGSANPFTLAIQNSYNSTGLNIGLYSYMSGGGSGNAAGVYIDNFSSTTGIEYGIYVNSEDQNYFSGSVGIGTSTPLYKLDITSSTHTYTTYSSNTYSGISDRRAFYGTSINNPGYGYGGHFIGGYRGAYGVANATTYGFTAIGVYGYASGTAGTRYGVYGTASGGVTNYGVYCSGNGGYTGTWSNISDPRFKTNIMPLGKVLDKVLLLNPTTFSFLDNEDTKAMGLKPNEPQIGLISTEVELVFPELVKDDVHPGVEDENGRTENPIFYKGMNYIGLTPILVKAIQEQQETIDSQDKLIMNLEKRISALENR